MIDTGKAIELYEKCLSFEDNQPAVWYSLALTLSELKQYKEDLSPVTKRSITCITSPGTADTVMSITAGEFVNMQRISQVS